MTIRVIAGILAGTMLLGCGGSAGEPPSTEVRAARAATLPDSLSAQAWNSAPHHTAALRPQDMVDPRRMEVGISALRIRALHDGRSIAFRLEWDDPSEDKVRKPATFGDACAIQLPARPGPDLPAPQMGEPGKPVEITYWSAAAQEARGRDAEGIRALYPNAKIDHYPFEAESLKNDPAAQKKLALQYAPARSLGNTSRLPVQDLVAQGPGTLRPAEKTVSKGEGKRSTNGWVVLLTRPLPGSLASSDRAHVSFAIWDGAAGDTGSRKMWTPWISLILENREPAP